MPKNKLILICQCGGEFVTSADGCLSYTGGEAHALDVNHETVFDDLKLKLAEMCNFEYKSLSIKYFLPGNRRTLITLANDKDLKRMYDFHVDSVTADIFATGKEGFNYEDVHMLASRSSGLKQAETVPAIMASQDAASTPPIDCASTPTVARASSRSITRAGNRSITRAGSRSVARVGTGSAARGDTRSAARAGTRSAARAGDATVHSPVTNDTSGTPADTVKKRRRTASWKIGANGPTIVSDIEIVQETRESTKRKKGSRNYDTWNHDSWNHDTGIVNVDVKQLKESDVVPWVEMDNSHHSSTDIIYDDVSAQDVSLEQMIASWKDGIIGVGQEFKSVAEFRDVLQKYAIANRFMYKLKKNDTSRASGICAAEGCSWSIHASWVPSAEIFRIKKMNNEHTCGGESWKAAHPTKSWLVSIIKGRLRENPHHKPRDIANAIMQDFGIELHYSQVRRGIEEAREQLQGSYKESYTQLPWFCDKMMEANPGSFVKLEIDDISKFRRLFVSFHASIHGFENGCRPLLFLDSTSFRSRYHEVLLTATALDGNDDAFPFSFAIVDIENDDNWHWFLEQLRSAISTSQSITFVSDNEKGLMKSVLEIFENAHHGYSIYHLLENFRRNLKGPFEGEGKAALPVSLLRAAHAVRLDGFKMFTEQIKQVSSKAYDWLVQIEPQYWTNALFKGEHYTHVPVNIAEIYANWIEEVRELPIVQKVEALGCKMMELIHKRQTDSNGWTTKLTPSKEQKLHDEALKALAFKVLFSSDTLFEVHDDSIHVVDLVKRDCTCLQWKLTGLPCSHTVAVFNRKGISVYDYCSKYFTADNFRSTYSESINPVLDTSKPVDEEEDALGARPVLPPTTPKPPPQPKEKPIKRIDELRRVMTCSKCKGEGHNKATCKEPL
ncbi:uncharacterized protein LOC107262168 [Ricinus communis]|uniref:uncharacterized protein LOC107262168 n=1 Tax=Ricinus communis TaxID=3988 RepID=UPI000772A312|nr:uncharacterized protein LOC107262168 [Ricinus communis]|eukprot:XP_015581847.1 uncharacterized protein LOC107262168 [Ricinus communis]